MFSTIKNRLIGITIAIVVLTLLASTVATYFTVRGQTLSKVGNDLTELSRAHAATISAWVRTQKDIVTAMVPVAQAADAVPFLQQAAKSGRLDTAYVGFADKRIVFSSPQTLPPDYDPTSRPWYKLAEAAGAPVVTTPYADAATKRLVMTFALAVKSGGATQAVVASDVFMDEVVKTIQSIKPTANGFAFLVNKEGVVIAHPNAALSLKPASDISKGLDTQALARAADGANAMPAVTVGDAGYLLRAVPVEGTEWMLVSAANRAEALASVTSLLQTAGLVLVLALIAAAVAVTVAISSMLLGLARVRDAMDDIGSGSGDLSKRLPVAGHDEISQIAASFNQFAEKIASVIRQMRGVSDSIATASVQIATGNHDLSQRTEQAAASLQQTASSMEQFTSSVRQSADSARTASQLAGTAGQVAARGGQAVSEVVSTMDEINASSKKISEIIGVIDGIAFQTNILALNAAVEAARAGEQGRGFAVVASEVRSLAGRSAQAAREIKDLIGASVERVEAGTRQVQGAGSTMNEIVSSVQRVTGIIGEIASATSEQSEGIGQVNIAISQLDQMTQQNAALVEQSAAAASSMKDQAQRLAEVVSTFRLGDEQERVAVRGAAPAAAPRPSLPRASLPTAPKPASAPKPVASKAPVARAALGAPAKLPAKAAAAKGAEDDWESF